MEACARVEIDTHGKEKTYTAAVHCNKYCETCAWNPTEQKRRFATGEMKPVHTRRGYDLDTGASVERVLPEGTMQLVFKKREVTDV